MTKTKNLSHEQQIAAHRIKGLLRMIASAKALKAPRLAWLTDGLAVA